MAQVFDEGTRACMQAAPIPSGRATRKATSERRCNRCRRVLAVSLFANKTDCKACAERYRGWGKLTFAEKIARRPRRLDPKPGGFVIFNARSKNKKLGGIPMSISERGTCPSSCSFFEAGCFAEFGYPGVIWRSVGVATNGYRGAPWRDFLAAVRELAPDTLWRHNVAGDLPGNGKNLDRLMLEQLVRANAGRRGFTYTHKPLDGDFDALVVAEANDRGFTINLSADSLEQADDFAARAIAPVVVVVAHDAPLRLRTPAGRRVVICPAETEAKLTCAECELCANSHRKSIIGFRAHGQYKALVTEIVRSKRAA